MQADLRSPAARLPGGAAISTNDRRFFNRKRVRRPITVTVFKDAVGSQSAGPLMLEPFAALGAQNRARVQADLGRSLASDGPQIRMTMILVNHGVGEAILLSDRIALVTRHLGRVKANDRVEPPRPRHEADPALIGLQQRIRELIHREYEPEH